MSNAKWDPEEIDRLALTTGKPAEVACAQAFLAAGWLARLGSYYLDGAAELRPPRELDVLAIREAPPLRDRLPIRRVRILVSCRGFAPDTAPLTYSSAAIPPFDPRLPTAHVAARPRPGGATNTGSMLDIEAEAARKLLDLTSLRGTRPLVALDMMERAEVLDRKTGAQRVEYKRQKDGDSRLFSAFDSALKAALYWAQEDYQGNSGYFASLNIPVCVLSLPFWDACIDPGTAAEPELRTRGYQTGLYPSRPRAREVLTLVWSQDDLTALVRALDDIFEWFVAAIDAEATSQSWS